MSVTLPKFDNPPIAETVLSVAFKPIVGWGVQHLGLYLNRMRSEYPDFAVQPSLPNEIEVFNAPQHKKEISFEIGPMNMRAWYSGKKGGWLVQIQNNRFMSNWRHEQGAKYPNFKGFKEQFVKEWTRFKSFLEAEKLPVPEVVQAEVVYVNHIDLENEELRIEKIFPMWTNVRSESLIGDPEGVAINAVYPMPDEAGRLYISIQPVVRHSDVKDVLQFMLTGRRLLSSKNDAEITAALKLSHDYVVSGFADFTTKEMHKQWERIV